MLVTKSQEPFRLTFSSSAAAILHLTYSLIIVVSFVIVWWRRSHEFSVGWWFVVVGSVWKSLFSHIWRTTRWPIFFYSSVVRSLIQLANFDLVSLRISSLTLNLLVYDCVLRSWIEEVLTCLVLRLFFSGLHIVTRQSLSLWGRELYFYLCEKQVTIHTVRSIQIEYLTCRCTGNNWAIQDIFTCWWIRVLTTWTF